MLRWSIERWSEDVSEDIAHELSGDATLVDYLGVAIVHDAPARLCRCGQAKTKPFCDDVCKQNGFTGAKDPRRITDRLDVYAGASVRVFDNRGLCAHSGFCTNRVPGAFHVGTEPFVTPSGARADDLLRESEERYRVFIESNSDAMWRIELDRPIPIDLDGDEQIARIYRDGYLAECNEALARMLGATTSGIGAFEQDAGCLNVIDVDDNGRFLVRLLNHSPLNALKLGVEWTTMERLYGQYLQRRPV